MKFVEGAYRSAPSDVSKIKQALCQFLEFKTTVMFSRKRANKLSIVYLVLALTVPRMVAAQTCRDAVIVFRSESVDSSLSVRFAHFGPVQGMLAKYKRLSDAKLTIFRIVPDPNRLYDLQSKAGREAEKLSLVRGDSLFFSQDTSGETTLLFDKLGANRAFDSIETVVAREWSTRFRDSSWASALRFGNGNEAALDSVVRIARSKLSTRPTLLRELLSERRSALASNLSNLLANRDLDDDHWKMIDSNGRKWADSLQIDKLGVLDPWMLDMIVTRIVDLRESEASPSDTSASDSVRFWTRLNNAGKFHRITRPIAIYSAVRWAVVFIRGGLLVPFLEHALDLLNEQPFDPRFQKLVSEKLSVARRLSAHKPAPEFALIDSTGVVHHLHDYRGKVLFVNFWVPGAALADAKCPHLRSFRKNSKVIRTYCS